MNDNLIEAQYEVSKKSKIRRFYDTNKIFIYSFIFILIISLVSFSFYLGQKNKKKNRNIRKLYTSKNLSRR